MFFPFFIFKYLFCFVLFVCFYLFLVFICLFFENEKRGLEGRKEGRRKKKEPHILQGK